MIVAVVLIGMAAGGSPVDTLAVVGGTLIDGRGGRPVADATIIAIDGTITAIGPSRSVRAPKHARVVDAHGKYVLPGFIDTNVHLTRYNFAVVDSWNDSAAVLDALRAARELAQHGVTTARDTYGFLPVLMAMRHRAGADSQVSARVLIAGNILGWGDPWSYTFSGSTGGRPRTEEVRRLSAALVQGVGEDLVDLPADSLEPVVDRYLDSGPDFLKIGVTTHTAGPAPLLFSPGALRAIVALAHRRGKMVDAHAGNAGALEVAALAGIDVLQHPEDAGGYRISAELAHMLVERGVVCSMMPAEVTGPRWKEFEEHVALGGRMWPAEMPPERMRARRDSLRMAGSSLEVPRSPSILRWQNRRANAELLIRSGCTVSVATDALVGNRPMGERTWNAIAGLVELGMTPMQAIVAATHNGARAAGKLREIGTIEIGKRVDLVILRDNPLSDIRNIRAIDAVIVGGRQ